MHPKHIINSTLNIASLYLLLNYELFLGSDVFEIISVSNS